MSNRKLHKAKKVKNDEYYTLYEDIAEEMDYFKDKFDNKTIFFPCDDPQYSNFFKFFVNKFEEYNICKMYFLYLGADFAYEVNKTNIKQIKEDINNFDKYTEKHRVYNGGGFETEESLEFLKKSDIIITNPPFSITQILKDLIITNRKDYILLDPLSAAGNNKNLDYILNGDMHVSLSKPLKFLKPDGSYKSVPVNWITSYETYDKKKKKRETKKKAAPRKIATFKEEIIELQRLEYLELIPDEIKDNYILALPVTFLGYPYEKTFEIIDPKKLTINDGVEYLEEYYTKNNKKTGRTREGFRFDHPMIKCDDVEDVRSRTYLKDSNGNIYDRPYKRIYAKKK